jgi:hypothetical protein
MTQRFEHCRLTGTQVQYLGRTGLFEDKSDSSGSEAKAWDWLEKQGWELVTVVSDKDGNPVAYFKRPYGEK